MDVETDPVAFQACGKFSTLLKPCPPKNRTTVVLLKPQKIGVSSASQIRENEDVIVEDKIGEDNAFSRSNGVYNKKR
jgi:hypothetical protein